MHELRWQASPFCRNDQLNYFRVVSSMPTTSYQVNPKYAILSEIVPGLFICGVSELNRDNIDNNGITLIINATTEVGQSFPERGPNYAEEK